MLCSPRKAACARWKATTEVPASDMPLCPSQVLLAGCPSPAGAGPKLIPFSDHWRSLARRGVQPWWLGGTPVPAPALGLYSTPDATGTTGSITSSAYSKVTQKKDATGKIAFYQHLQRNQGLSRLWRTNSPFCPAVSLIQKKLQRVLEKLISKLISIPWRRALLLKAGRGVLGSFWLYLPHIKSPVLGISVRKDTGLFKEGESHAAFLFITVHLIYCFMDTMTKQSVVRTVRLQACTVPVLGANTGS